MVGVPIPKRDAQGLNPIGDRYRVRRKPTFTVGHNRNSNRIAAINSSSAPIKHPHLYFTAYGKKTYAALESDPVKTKHRRLATYLRDAESPGGVSRPHEPAEIGPDPSIDFRGNRKERGANSKRKGLPRGVRKSQILRHRRIKKNYD